MKIEKVLLILVEGINVKETEILGRLKSNLTMKNFKLEEFEEEGLEICKHIEFYINECVTKLEI
jgi:hypothetical protein